MRPENAEAPKTHAAFPPLPQGHRGLQTSPTTPVLTRPQPQRTKGPRYPTHSTACETQPQDNATSRPPRQHQGHVTCGPGSWNRPHPGGQPAGTAKLARRSSHAAVDSPHATTECTRTPGSPETRIRDPPLPSAGTIKTLDLDPATRGTCTPRARMHLQHAPGTVRPLPSWNRAVVLATPEGTRTTASGHVRPQDTAAYMDQAVRRTAMWLPTARGTLHSTGTETPYTSPPDRQAAPHSKPGPRHMPHPAWTRTISLPRQEPGPTYCLHLDPDTHARTAYHTVPRRLGRRTTKDSDRRGPRVQATRSQDTLRQHSVSPLQRPTIGQEGQPAGLSTSKAASH